MLARSPPPGAARSRKSRIRQKRGCRCFQVEVDWLKFYDALVASGRTTEEQLLRPGQLEAEVERLVLDFIARWR